MEADAGESPPKGDETPVPPETCFVRRAVFNPLDNQFLEFAGSRARELADKGMTGVDGVIGASGTTVDFVKGVVNKLGSNNRESAS